VEKKLREKGAAGGGAGGRERVGRGNKKEAGGKERKGGGREKRVELRKDGRRD